MRIFKILFLNCILLGATYAQVTDARVIQLVEEEAAQIDSWVQLTDNQLVQVVSILKKHEAELNGYYVRNNEFKNFNKITRKLNKTKNKNFKKVMKKSQYKLYVFFDKNRKKSSKEYVMEVYDAIKGHPRCQKELYNYHTDMILPVYNGLGRDIQEDMTSEEVFKLDSIGTDVYDKVSLYYNTLVKNKKTDFGDPKIQDSLKQVTEIVDEGTELYKGIKSKYNESLEDELNYLTDSRLKWNAEQIEIISKYIQGSALAAIQTREEEIDKLGLNKEIINQTILMLKPGQADRYLEFIDQFKTMILEFETDW